MMISGLTPRDSALAEIASDLAGRLFPDLPDGYRIGAFQNQVVQESRLLFLGDGFLGEIGRVKVLTISDVKEPLLWATACLDYAAAVAGHGILVNFLGLCRTEQHFILIDEKLVDPATEPGRAVLAHEIAHGAMSCFPPHGAAWRERVRAAATAARDMDLDALAFALDAGPGTGWKGYRPSPDAPADCEVPDVYLDHVCGQWTAAAQRFKIVLSDGTSLRAWLDMRKAAGWGPER